MTEQSVEKEVLPVLLEVRNTTLCKNVENSLSSIVDLEQTLETQVHEKNEIITKEKSNSLLTSGSSVGESTFCATSTYPLENTSLLLRYHCKDFFNLTCYVCKRTLDIRKELHNHLIFGILRCINCPKTIISCMGLITTLKKNEECPGKKCEIHSFNDWCESPFNFLKYHIKREVTVDKFCQSGINDDNSLMKEVYVKLRLYADKLFALNDKSPWSIVIKQIYEVTKPVYGLNGTSNLSGKKADVSLRKIREILDVDKTHSSVTTEDVQEGKEVPFPHENVDALHQEKPMVPDDSECTVRYLETNLRKNGNFDGKNNDGKQCKEKLEERGMIASSTAVTENYNGEETRKASTEMIKDSSQTSYFQKTVNNPGSLRSSKRCHKRHYKRKMSFSHIKCRTKHFTHTYAQYQDSFQADDTYKSRRKELHHYNPWDPPEDRRYLEVKLGQNSGLEACPECYAVICPSKLVVNIENFNVKYVCDGCKLPIFFKLNNLG
ncbi:hypothetical protein SK128_024418 [Halocaridina rubra]|uniref:Uncharacterized protein n=1 Tax=Halocaridina rubra TaxID=373956 RepID=A0AAN8X5L9_HALRR